MMFALRFCLISIPAAMIAVSPASATEPKIDAETCTQLRLEHMKYVESGTAKDLERGAEWGKANLSPEKLRDLELFIQLDEQIKFGCRDAVLTMDAQRAAEVAKRLEINSDLDPTLPLPAATKAAGDGDGAAGEAQSDQRPAKPKSKHKSAHKSKPDDAAKAAVSGDAAPAVAAPEGNAAHATP